MKLMSVLFTGVLIAGPAMAGRYAGPVLVKADGKLANLGTAKVCEVYPSSPELKGVDFQKLILEADGEKITKALHVRAQVPSVEYYAYKVVDAGGGKTSAVKAVKVLLLQDYSDSQTRDGAAAADLIKLIDEACK